MLTVYKHLRHLMNVCGCRQLNILLTPHLADPTLRHVYIGPYRLRMICLVRICGLRAVVEWCVAGGAPVFSVPPEDRNDGQRDQGRSRNGTYYDAGNRASGEVCMVRGRGWGGRGAS